jgi:glycosyltransferase involved in cell wall biosynthesis
MNYKNKDFSLEYNRGIELMKNSSVSICSIVRDCQKNLEHNIPNIERLRLLFKNSEVIIFENDSKDNTLKVLENYKRKSSNVHIINENYQVPSIPSQAIGGGNRYFSVSRIEKMTFYRNKYINFLNNQGIKRDYVIVIDLDISNFSIDGLIHSFGAMEDWDCISANGVSLSANFKNQYHDSYALIEYGKLNNIQTEKSIKDNRNLFSTLKPGMPLVKVDSAYGGIAIYNWSSIKDTFYSCLLNNDIRVQCKSEHVGLHKKMIENGHTRIFINPSMVVKYRSVSLRFLYLKLKERVSKIIKSQENKNVGS